MHIALKNILLVGAGGFAGSVLRYLIASMFKNSWAGMPLGTLVANILGCFIIGIFCHTVPIGRTLTDSMKLVLAIGFCGGLTTASSLIQQTVTLHRTGNSSHAAGYLALTMLTTFMAFYAGLYVSKLIVKG